jgi:hypothetical protein
MIQAANAPTFEPLVLVDPAFMDWALLVGLRLRNIPPGSPDGAIEQAILKDGQPCPEWAQGLAFMMTLATV